MEEIQRSPPGIDKTPVKNGDKLPTSTGEFTGFLVAINSVVMAPSKFHPTNRRIDQLPFQQLRLGNCHVNRYLGVTGFQYIIQ